MPSGAQALRLEVGVPGSEELVDVFDEKHSRADASGTHHIELAPYGWRWLRVGRADSVLERETER